jgi:amino acid adenylation domain-containing protein
MSIVHFDTDARYASFPLRDVQQAYWIGREAGLDLGNVSAYGYYEHEATTLDVERLQAAWQRLIDRHDMLRMIVRPDGQQQVLPPPCPYLIAVNDLRELSHTGVEDAFSSIRARLSHQRRQYERWPLFVVEASMLPGGAVRVHFGIDFVFCDAWSFRVILRELAMVYRDPEAVLPDLAISFRDYVLAERRLTETEEYRTAWDYWMARVGDIPGAPALPVAVTPGEITEPQFDRLSFALSATESAHFCAQAAASRVTPTAALLSAYADVLALYSGESRFTVNVTLFSRMQFHPQVNDIVGDFTSLIPLVVETNEREPFPRRSTRIQQQLWRDIDHRLVSGPTVMREQARRLGLRRTETLPIVFTSLLGLEDESQAGDSLTLWNDPAAMCSISQTPQVWLDCIILETDGRIRIALQYVRGLFFPEVIEGVFESFRAQVQRMSAESGWDHIAPQLAEAHNEVIASVNVVAPIAPFRLEEGFLRHAAVAPHDPAVITTDRVIGYGELERHTGSLANRLHTMLNGGVTVGVVMERGWEQVAAVLAVLRAGAAYVPIDPTNPVERLHHLLSDSGIEIVLTQSWLAGRIPWPPHVRCISVDHQAPALPDEPVVTPPLGQEDLAYVIYTSGSTGAPKGVMVSHRSAVNTILEVNRMCALSNRDRVLSVSSLGFDLSVYDIFGALAAGAAVVLPDPSAHPTPEQWVDMIHRHEVTIWNSVPALLQLLLETTSPAVNERLVSLRVAMLSGDWIPVTLPYQLRQRCPDARVLAMGGATEGSIWSIYKWVDRVEETWTSIPYGRPLANQQMHVLNSALRHCPIWTTGEIYIGGEGVARGYWRDDERTAASFIHHHVTHERLYRTGDFGRYLPEGEIEFLGRRDTQVKVLGHRIELGEIECALSTHAAVQACVAKVSAARTDQKCLVAYIVPRPGSEIEPGEIRELLASKLPAYMVPRHVMVLGALPLTPNGKVDRAALPEPDRDHETERRTPESCSVVQAHIATFWTEVLHVEGIGIHDDFFELGGDSLAATRVITRMNEAFECTLPVGTLFDSPTIAELSDRVADVTQTKLLGEPAQQPSIM